MLRRDMNHGAMTMTLTPRVATRGGDCDAKERHGFSTIDQDDRDGRAATTKQRGIEAPSEPAGPSFTAPATSEIRAGGPERVEGPPAHDECLADGGDREDRSERPSIVCRSPMPIVRARLAAVWRTAGRSTARSDECGRRRGPSAWTPSGDGRRAGAGRSRCGEPTRLGGLIICKL